MTKYNIVGLGVAFLTFVHVAAVLAIAYLLSERLDENEREGPY